MCGTAYKVVAPKTNQYQKPISRHECRVPKTNQHGVQKFVVNSIDEKLSGF